MKQFIRSAPRGILSGNAFARTAGTRPDSSRAGSMRILKRLLLCLFLFGAALAASAAGQAASPDASQTRVHEVLRKIAAHNKNVKRIESDFVQTRYVAFLDEELVSEGFFVFRNPDELFWQYDAPAVFRLEYKNGKASFGGGPEPESGRPQNAREAELAARIAEQIMLWISMDPSRIQAAYTVEIRRHEPLCLLLVPKKKSSVIPVREMSLEFAPNNLDLASLTLLEDDGDYIRLEFSNSRRFE